MAEYTVTIPLAGAIHITVVADSQKEACERAWDRLNDVGDRAGDLEYEYMEKITQGNVLYAPFNEVEVNEY